MSFKLIEANEISKNIFDLIGKDWFLITAGNKEAVNSMTVAWATMGVLWGEPVAIVAVRPERYTREFLDREKTFSLNVFDKSRRKMLGYFGTVSGRDEDKIKKSGLTVIFDDETPYFEENIMSINCRKICVTQLSEKDFNPSPKSFINKWYGGENKLDGTGGGYHLLYIGKIEKVLVKEQ